MFSETLITPHPRRHSELRQPLYDELRLAETADKLTVLQTTNLEAYREEATRSANSISKGVHRALWFSEANGGDPALRSPEQFQESQTSNCYGYTIVLSECLERAGIRHWVGFVNGHALTVVQPDKNADPWLIDALTPQFNAPLQNNISDPRLTDIEHQIRRYDRGAIKFSSDSFIASLDQQMSFDEAADQHPWLSFERSYKTGHVFSDTEEREKIHKQRTLVMSLFEPDQGRKILIAHNKLSLALSEKKRAQAYRSFKELQRLYPDVDIRNEPRDISLLVRELGSVGCVGIATKVVDQTREGFSISQDPRHDVWQADMYRWLGNKAKDKRLLEQAINIYDQALSKAKYPETIKSKRAKAERMLSRFALTV